MQINLVLNKNQLSKFSKQAGFQMTADQLHSSEKPNATVLFDTKKDYNKYVRAHRNNKGLRLSAGTYSHSGVDATPKSNPTAMSEVDIEGGKLFGRIGKAFKKTVNKGVTQAKSTANKGIKQAKRSVKSEANQFIKESRSIANKEGKKALKGAKEAGKTTLKAGVSTAIAGATTAILTPALGPAGAAVAGSVVSNYASKPINKKIDGLGFDEVPVKRGRGRPRVVNNQSNVFADGLNIPDNKQSVKKVKVIKGAGFLNV